MEFHTKKYLYPRVPPFREKIAYVSIFTKYCPVEQKKNVICQANTYITIYIEKKIGIHSKKEREAISGYTQWDNTGLSNEINIYIPEFHHFEKKLLM